ncbi:hypothetical protein [Burkholderia cepacia]|uniref:hypothetical protein n=1 Tax=Burkholderia cepacia TaxID=292 RepID=UPI00264D8243|nr:hypothetical protein [Burkholderia cepacia]MDN7638127.1 hypothetical protein [Burkholderia cepacia]
MKVEIEEGGLRYVADVHEVDGVVSVHTDAGGVQATARGGSSVDAIARIMLRQLVRSGKADPLPL